MLKNQGVKKCVFKNQGVKKYVLKKQGVKKTEVLKHTCPLQSYSRGIELCHGPDEVNSCEPEVPGKPVVIRKTTIGSLEAIGEQAITS